jgi:hypothetical protein
VARVTFQKRQKEMKRQEKQRMKAERRVQRKLEKISGPEGGTSDIDFSASNDFDIEIDNGDLDKRFPAESETAQ